MIRGFDANAQLRVDFNGDDVDILQNGRVVNPGNLITDANGRATFTSCERTTLFSAESIPVVSRWVTSSGSGAGRVRIPYSPMPITS